MQIRCRPCVRLSIWSRVPPQGREKNGMWPLRGPCAARRTTEWDFLSCPIPHLLLLPKIAVQIQGEMAVEKSVGDSSGAFCARAVTPPRSAGRHSNGAPAKAAPLWEKRRAYRLDRASIAPGYTPGAFGALPRTPEPGQRRRRIPTQILHRNKQ